MERTGKHVKAVIGLGVVAVSLFGVIAPAAAAAPSRTTLSSSTPSIGVGSTAKLKAVVKQVTGTLQPTGSVTFREGTTATSPIVGTGPVTLVTAFGVMTAKLDLTPSLGNHTYIATYSGSTAFNASTSLTINIQVTAVAKTNSTTVGSSSTPSVSPGAEVKLKAVVKQSSGTVKPTGSVTFFEGAVALATTPAPAPLVLIGTVETAKATISSLTQGTHQITAVYSGSDNFNASTSPAFTVTIGKYACTAQALVNSTGTVGKYTLVALVKATDTANGVPTGIVTFIVDTQVGQPQAELVNGRASVTGVFLDPGSHTLRVNYPGDTVFNACSGSITKTLT